MKEKNDNITQDELKTLLSYESSTGVFTWKAGIREGKIAGVNVSNGRGNTYRRLHVKKNNIYSHRAAWIYTYGNIPFGMDIDHINGNGLDNSIANLRLATRQQNSANAMPRKASAGKPKGVSYDKARNKWVAVVKFNYKVIHIGRFQTKEEAHDAYCKKAIELFGEFHRAGYGSPQIKENKDVLDTGRTEDADRL